MSFSCEFFRIKPENTERVKDFLKTPGSQQYKVKESADDRVFLKIYIDEEDIEENQYGHRVKCLIDRSKQFWSKDDGEQLVKQTTEVEIEVFDKEEDMNDFIAVFSPTEKRKLFVEALSGALGTSPDDIFLQFDLNLNKHREELEKKFGDFRRAFVKNMDNDVLSSTRMKGVNLEKGSDYNRFMQDYGGKLSTIAVDYRDHYLMISNGGRIHSPSNINGGFDQKVDLVRDIIRDLRGIEDIQIGGPGRQTSFSPGDNPFE